MCVCVYIYIYILSMYIYVCVYIYIYILSMYIYVCVYIYIYIYIHTHTPYLLTPLLGQDMTQGQFFKRSSTGLNSELSFS